MENSENLEKLDDLKYHLKLNTIDNKIVDITRLNCFESLLKLMHIEWSIYNIHKELGAGDFEISLTENLCKGLASRPIFFYESKKIIRIRI